MEEQKTAKSPEPSKRRLSNGHAPDENLPPPEKKANVSPSTVSSTASTVCTTSSSLTPSLPSPTTTLSSQSKMTPPPPPMTSSTAPSTSKPKSQALVSSPSVVGASLAVNGVRKLPSTHPPVRKINSPPPPPQSRKMNANSSSPPLNRKINANSPPPPPQIRKMMASSPPPPMNRRLAASSPPPGAHSLSQHKKISMCQGHSPGPSHSSGPNSSRTISACGGGSSSDGGSCSSPASSILSSSPLKGMSNGVGASNKCSYHAIQDKFQPQEELVKQIMDMGICRNGAVKALYWTGNKSAVAASNWIFDQPERDLDTPLEDELEMIRAQQIEREREELEREKAYSRIVRRVHHNHVHHHLHEEHMLDEDYLEDLHHHDDLDDDEDDEDEDEDEEEDEDEDELDVDFKMVFVINRSLDLSPGQMTMSTSKATAGLFRKIYSQAQSAAVGPDELAMWGDFGERTVILWADTEQHIKDLELMAKSLRLPCFMVDTFAEIKTNGDSRGGSDPGRHASPADGRIMMENGRLMAGEGGKALYKSVLGLFGEERELNKVTGRLKVVP